MTPALRLFVVSVAVLACFSTQPAAHAQGVMLRGAGAVNEAVGGTATAMPLDASGALLWNPGTISALPKNEMTLGLGLIQAHSRVESSVPVAPGGSTKGEAGVVPVPSMGFVWSTSRRSPFTYGIGLAAVGGAASLYPQAPLFTVDANGIPTPNPDGNPILNAHGRSASVVVLQMTPTVAVQLTDRMSVGVAPIIDLASLNINPMSLGRPLTEPLMTYGTRYVWGGGFQIGTYYDFQNHFKAGFTFKSPIWAEDLYFTGTNDQGQPRSNNFSLNLPMTLSAGISYDGFRNTVIGMDVRYFDYANTAGFDKGLNPATGIVEGLDWESVFSISVGMERRISHRLKGRLGYCWNENPIPGRSTALCVSAPMMTQHVLSFGIGYAFAKNLELSATYCRAFEAKSSGTILGTPGTSVTNIMSADTFNAGLTKKW